MHFLMENNKNKNKKFWVTGGPGWVPMTPWASRPNIGPKVCDVARLLYVKGLLIHNFEVK